MGCRVCDYDRAKEVLKIPDLYQVEAMIAVGRPGKKEDLPAKSWRENFPHQERRFLK